MSTRFRRAHMLIILLLALCFAGTAQVSRIAVDSSKITVRSIPPASINEYRSDDAFDYQQQRAQGSGFWDRFWDWVFGAIAEAEANKSLVLVMKIVMFGIIIFIFVYAFLKISGMNRGWLFSKNKKADVLDYLVTEDDIYTINFSESIGLAINQRNYRLAIRLLYLQTLRRLSDAELINWKLNKTNDVYVSELSPSAYHRDFATLTHAYDYAWYGEVAVAEEQFKTVHNHFLSFQQKLPA